MALALPISTDHYFEETILMIVHPYYDYNYDYNYYFYPFCLSIYYFFISYYIPNKIKSPVT